MKDIMTKALNHPIGTAILIGTIVGGVTSIIRAVRGVSEPAIVIDIGKNPTE